MPNFGTRWIEAKLLQTGGQAQTYTVVDGESPDRALCVAKIVNNPRPDRKERFLQEIKESEGFDHPNVVHIIEKGETVNSRYPFFVMPHYSLGTLESNYSTLGTPINKLRIFLAICRGVDYAHKRQLIHRDLKPSNIFLTENNIPIVGDFGLCYRADEDNEGRVTQTSEAVGARKYMPPEWREGRTENPLPTGDIYSLGKILYWLFKERVYDGHEEDHLSEDPVLQTSNVLQNPSNQGPEPWTLAYSVVSEIVGRTVLKRPENRIASVEKLIDDVTAAIERIENLGRVLDFNLPKRCLFCAAGTYQLPKDIPFPLRTARGNPPSGFLTSGLVHFVLDRIGIGKQASGHLPIYLTCNICGNIQYFRIDLTSDKSGQKWNP